MFRSYIPSSVKYNWKFGLALIVILTIARFILVIDANITKSYHTASIIFLIMIILPFLILNKSGRKTIGIIKPKSFLWLISSLVIGIAISSITYLIFCILYDDSISNSFVYIAQSYAIDGLNDQNRLLIFLILCPSVMTFSPFGEELFYRGLVHGSFVSEFGEKRASIFDSLAFAIAHLPHFGLIYTLEKGITLLFIPALIWMCCMYFLSRAFFYCKQKSGSILGAIIAHAGFNIAMTYWIIYHIL